MTRYRLEVRVTPREGLLDPEGNAIAGALHNLDYDEVGSVRVGRLILLDVSADTESDALQRADEMCRELLANPVTEDYDIRTLDGG